MSFSSVSGALLSPASGDMSKPCPCFPGRVSLGRSTWWWNCTLRRAGGTGRRLYRPGDISPWSWYMTKRRGERPLQEEVTALRRKGPFFVLSSEREADGRLKGRAPRGSGWGLGRTGWSLLFSSPKISLAPFFLLPSPQINWIPIVSSLLLHHNFTPDSSMLHTRIHPEVKVLYKA